MNINDLRDFSDQIEIIREGDFNSLGLIVSSPGIKILTYLDDKKYLDKMSKYVNAILTYKEFASFIGDEVAMAICDNPRAKFFEFHNYLVNKNNNYVRKSFQTKIGNACKISSMAFISEKNVKIGNRVTIEEFVSIKENVAIGDDVVIRAGSVIGGEGFEYKKDDQVINVIHGGGVIIENDVRIHHNCCIDKAVFPWDNTVISEGSRLDNGVYIAHGVKLGKRCFITGNVVIGGRTIIGDDTKIGFNATISNGLCIGHKSYIHLGAVVTKNLEQESNVSGNFAIDHNKFIDFIRIIR
jgi:UDP-3-O-[3-hydroxymyristoyl] glucosamine N-acyltransferase